MNKPKKLYRCPKCGDTLTEFEYEADFEIGGNGMCPCDFKDGERVFYEYDTYILEVKDKKEKPTLIVTEDGEVIRTYNTLSETKIGGKDA